MNLGMEERGKQDGKRSPGNHLINHNVICERSKAEIEHDESTRPISKVKVL